jgi:hypothetical protein
METPGTLRMASAESWTCRIHSSSTVITVADWPVRETGFGMRVAVTRTSSSSRVVS